MTEMKITGGKGVHFSFENGVTISVQIGRGNYSDNYDYPHYEVTRESPLPSSRTAEIAVWSSDGAMIDLRGDLVMGWVPIDDVMNFMEFLRSMPSDLEKQELELAISPFEWKN